MELLRNVIIGQFIPGTSIIHRMDARIKIILVFILMIVLFMIHSLAGMLLYTALVLTTLILSRIPFSYILRGLRTVFILVIITVIFNVFFTKGDIICKFYFIEITKQGLELGFLMVFRIMMLLVLTSILTLTTSSINLTDALESLMLPLRIFKFPAHEIAMMMTIALRFVPILLFQTEKIIKAQVSRGADFTSGSLVKRAKALVPILVPLFISAFKSAEELAVAMEARCYQTGIKRTKMRVQNITNLDLVVFLTASAWIIVMVLK
ncbi:MAG: energy-coupling factor transporter transmembrane component T [Armatimonadota bacterium]